MMPVFRILNSREMAIALCATATIGALWTFGWTTAMERPVWDLLMRIPRPGGTPSPGMAAVLLDDDSVQSIGPLPWPRARLAQLVSRVRDAGAHAVVVDMLLSHTGDPTGDEDLARVFARGPTAAAAVLAVDGTWLLPASTLGGLDIAAHAHAEVASDGVLRVISSTKQAQGVSLPALSLAAARHAGWTGGIEPGMLIRPDYSIHPQAIPTTSAADLLAGRVDSETLRSMVVFIGVSASGAGDQFLVPVGDRHRPVPGVLVHAAIAASITHGRIVQTLPWWAGLTALFIAAAAPQIARSRSARLQPSILAALVAAIPAAAIASLWVVRLLVPGVSLLATALVSVTLREILESRGAQRETDVILKSLVDLDATRPVDSLPPGVQGRLRLAQLLQSQLIRDNDLRRTLLEGLAEGVVLWDADGSPLLHNDTIVQLWGTVPHRDEVDEHTDDGAEPNENDREVVRAGRTLEVSSRPVGGGHLALVRDVSEHRELERRRREMQRLVSHELKTPLASIAGFGAMLERYELTSDELSRTAGMIRSEAERLGEMVKRFLDLERLGSGHWEEDRTVFDLAAVVVNRCEVLSATAGKRKIEISVETPEAAPVSGVRQLVEELVDNLIGNAVKYSPEGSSVGVAVLRRADRTVLEVADHGPGISEQLFDKIFERFYRVPGAAAPGTGLGLALVKEVAEWHRATVKVNSEVGHGSVFTVDFAHEGD